MKWNDGKERAKFEKEHEKLRKEYLAAGMTEEQIQDIFEYDWAEYRRARIEAIHTQELDFDSAEFNDKETDNPLYQKFLSAISVTMDYSDSSRLGWINEVENPSLYQALKMISIEDLEVLTEWLVDGLTITEIAKKQGRHKSNMSRQITRLKSFLKNFL